MKQILVIPILAASLVVWSGCTRSNTPTETASLSDSDVEQAIKNRIQSEPKFRTADVDVDADVDSSMVTLSGTVYRQTDRTQLVEIAHSVQPGFIVNDKIDVKPLDVPLSEYTQDMANEARESASRTGEKLGGKIEDAWLHTKIKSKLAVDGNTSATAINVDVENNAVTLRGQVDSLQAKREAGRIATETSGVRRVNNQLVVQTPGS